MSHPDDQTLTISGLAPRAQGRVLLLACGALAHEVLAIKKAGGWDHLDLQCLPANLHLWPDRIPPAVETAVEAARGTYQSIYVLYAACGTGGQLAPTCARAS